MTTKPENPPAFPYENDANKQYNYIREGMTLRDYFAAAALTGMLSYQLLGTAGLGEAAAGAYRYADAMLRARAE